MKEKTIAILLIVSISLNIVSIGMGLEFTDYELIKKKINQKIYNPEYFEDCDNHYGVGDTVSCWRDVIKGFYNYTERIDTIKTFDDIIDNGGDCYDYTYMYDRLAKEKGYKTEVEIIYSDDETRGHAFIIIWSKDLSSYCFVDSLNVKCARFER